MKEVKTKHQLFPNSDIYIEAIKLSGKSVNRTQALPRAFMQVHTLGTS